MIKKMLVVALLCWLQGCVLLGMECGDSNCVDASYKVYSVLDLFTSVMTKLFKLPVNEDGQCCFRSQYSPNNTDIAICYELERNLVSNHGFSLDMRMICDSASPSEWQEELVMQLQYELLAQQKDDPNWDIKERLNALKSACKEIIEKLRSDWSKANQPQVENILSREKWKFPQMKFSNLDQYVLFVKEIYLKNEFMLLHHLAKKFSIEEQFKVDASDWVCFDDVEYDGPLDKKGNVCLLVKKSDFDKFMAIFGFKNSDGELLTV